MSTIIVSSGVVSSGLSLAGVDQLIVEAGGAADATIVKGNADVDIASGGLASGTVVSQGGRVAIAAGGVASATVVSSGGSEVVSSGGQASHAVVMSGGAEHLDVGGVETGTVVSSGGALWLSGAVVGSGVKAFAGETNASVAVSGVSLLKGAILVQESVVVGSGGRMVVRAGGGTAGTRVLKGGLEYDFGETVSTHVLSGASEFVESGGISFESLIRAGGGEVVHAGGAANQAVIAGGTLIVSSGGTALGSVIGSGGDEIIRSGGVANQVSVSGGTLTVASGGNVAGVLKMRSGKAIIDGTFAGDLLFRGSSAIVKVDNVSGFTGEISGLNGSGNKIDLAKFAFSSGETVSWNSSSGTLTVTDGALVAVLNIAGAHATSDFHLATDGHGGTYLTASAGSSTSSGGSAAVPAATRFVEAVAGFHGGRDQGFATVHAGGTAVLSASPVVTAATSGR